MSKDLVVYEGIVVSVSHGERDSGVRTGEADKARVGCVQ